MNHAYLHGFTFEVDQELRSNAWGDYYVDHVGALVCFDPDMCPADLVFRDYCSTARYLLTRCLAEAGELPADVYNEVLDRVRDAVELNPDRYIV